VSPILGIIVLFFLPLQGFWNFLIYVRPQVKRIRKSYPNKSFLWALQVVIFNPSAVRDLDDRGRSIRRSELSTPRQGSFHQRRTSSNRAENERKSTEDAGLHAHSDEADADFFVSAFPTCEEQSESVALKEHRVVESVDIDVDQINTTTASEDSKQVSIDAIQCNGMSSLDMQSSSDTGSAFRWPRRYSFGSMVDVEQCDIQNKDRSKTSVNDLNPKALQETLPVPESQMIPWVDTGLATTNVEVIQNQNTQRKRLSMQSTSRRISKRLSFSTECDLQKSWIFDIDLDCDGEEEVLKNGNVLPRRVSFPFLNRQISKRLSFGTDLDCVKSELPHHDPDHDGDEEMSVKSFCQEIK